MRNSAKTMVMAVAAALIATQAVGEPNVVWLKKGDHSLDSAKAEAQATLPIFWRHFAEDRGVEHALVKIGFPTAHGGLEYLWLAITEFTDKGVRGEIVNEPEDVPNIHDGQSYEARISEIIDWAYIKGGKSYGQFTTRALLARDPNAFGSDVQDLAATPLEPGDH